MTPASAIAFSGYTVLCAGSDGSVTEAGHGLFHRDTRVLSRHRLTVADSVPELVSDSRPESDRWEAVLRVPRAGGQAEGPLLPQDAIEIHVRRRVGPGMLELVTVSNHSAVACDTVIALEVDGDFADVAELGRPRVQQGRIDRTPEHHAGALRLDYEVERDGRRVVRGLRIEVDASSPPDIGAGGFRFGVHLAARGEWRATLRFAALDGDRFASPQSIDADRRARQRTTWRARRSAIQCAEPLRVPFERAADDLFALRNWELEERFLGTTDGAGWVLNAGVPTFTGLFGRDVLTAAWQSLLLGSRAARGALEAVAATQATADDPWRDAEPGKLIHELRCGPVSELGLDPRDAYYGTQTTPAMFLLALSDAWHWTGDTQLLHRYRDVAMRALEWATTYGDADGDGFLEYERRSPRGLRNQGWKDSDEAIRHSDGTIAGGPIATVEEQGFYFLALERMAEILVALGEDATAEQFLDRADALRRQWHGAYWMPDERFYALALDGEKRQVRSIASNAGHALAVGIVPEANARDVADRLLEPDLFSGWGVRSLSDRHPSYNPFAYHLGALWPVEQATFALGFKRYGLDEHVDRLADAVFAAAFRSPDSRLPEALSGHGREMVPTPVVYPAAKSPQAWSASALIQLVQIQLGLYPFAPLGVLAIVHPRLPPWLPEVTLRRLRVGRASVDLQFRRRADGSASWRVSRRSGGLLVVDGGPPDAIGRASVRERLEYAVMRRAPGSLARAARIALGYR